MSKNIIDKIKEFNIVDERSIRTSFKVFRNAGLATTFYLFALYIYNTYNSINAFVNHMIVWILIINLVFSFGFYLLVTKKRKMNFFINVKYINNDELEQERISLTMFIYGVFMMLTSVIIFIIGLIEEDNVLLSLLSVYPLTVFSVSMLASSFYYKDYILPSNIPKESAYYTKFSPRLVKYIKSSLFSSILWNLLNIIVLKWNIFLVSESYTLNVIINLFFTFIIFLLLNILYGEINLRGMKKLEELFDD